MITSSSISFPILYKLDTHSKKRFWKVWVENDVVYRHDGIDNKDAKVKEISSKKIPSNTLRDGPSQALREAKKMWLKKIDDEFKPDDNDKEGKIMYENVISQKNEQNGSNLNIDLNKEKKRKKSSFSKIPVMLAKNFFKISEGNLNGDDGEISPFVKNLIHTAFQPKLDGIRCIAYYDSNRKEVVLKSRNMKEFSFLNHIRNDLKKIFEREDNKNLIFDGEIYYHDVDMDNVERYQFISSVVKINRKEPHEEENKVEYWIFDLIDEKMTFKERYKTLRKVIKEEKVKKNNSIVLVKTEFKDFEEEEDKSSFFTSIIHHYTDDLSFEGLMIRDATALYKNSRQSSLIKFKLFQDEEWKVIGAKSSVGGLQEGAVVWSLQSLTNPDLTVDAKQIGDVETSRRYYKNRNKYMGKKINIRFNEKTKDGIPRFPRAIAFVEDK